ncbi:class I SAM-dependent methyltransferase [Paeniroseomonas aquatica]|uniref:Class I SAM-dependent methyltransferase n=1 Tax=Paeniroseomonas aquatica TaxID=373043 RepID=A0ABT8AF34_9PROT|nr:class I SAM-dependent methyltransferase [Paeniroseomonas aquatica]MDN3568386.1 class I SAM-dependent methyltransferase [Paeniroseomonas aquatica]
MPAGQDSEASGAAATKGGAGAADAEAAPPHAPLLAYYPTPQAHSGFVRGLFNRTAGSYDRINAAFALGSGPWYRRRALRRAGLRPGARLLDVAIGTGLVAREAAAILGDTRGMVGLDLSEGMLAEARRSLGLPLVQARAEALPFPDASFDFVSMGYALRHVVDLGQLFAGYRRVLRPGGRLLLLEIAPPESRLGQGLLKAYLGGAVPLLSRLAGSGSATLMRYYWDTIAACVPPPEILRQLEKAGLSEVRCDTDIGIMRAYSARRPPA